MPGNYQPRPVKVSERVNTLLGAMKDQGEVMLSVYPYASHALGSFVKGIKSPTLDNKTIIAASGDHRMRYLMTDHT